MSALDQLPPLREVIARYDLAPKKSLGQNFLLDLNLTAKIARSAGDLTDVSVLEIGPGPGGLTRSLLAAGAKKVVVIERDQRFMGALEEIAEACPGRLEIIEGDGLALDHRSLVSGPVKIVANLPYNIATPLLIGWLATERWPPWFQSMTLMFQKEVAQRICAQPGNKTYGRLAVLAGWRFHSDIAFDVAPTAFIPPPKVTSSIINLIPKTNPAPCDVKKLQHVTKAAFGQRRKMLRASLKGLGGDALLEKAGIDGRLRAEVLSVEDFVRLAGLI
ncbi:MAG: 16S rRNA (adenine(1518)-N(6)/adenine(1519)-N(6))-dimethyltransferase RsmA [Rhizobiaceae bacterium]|nr:16S rRNA (adenine(1518)-N(6)/adenine(1519)-N(6))-dimethyltransferase RsmA [Rhizobiaceae bacterium]